jgi:hypothetical protein
MTGDRGFLDGCRTADGEKGGGAFYFNVLVKLNFGKGGKLWEER